MFFKTLFLVCLLFSWANSQSKDFAYLPVQNSSQALKESVPIYIADSVYLILYVSSKLDTIYSTRSFDAGKNWEIPKVVKTISPASSQKAIYLCGIKTKSGRILVAWHNVNEGMNVFHSDDTSNSWSETRIVLAKGLNNINRLQFLNLSQLNDGRISLSFNNEFVVYNIYYKESFNDGESFSDNLKQIVSPSSFYVVDGSILSDNNNHLVCIFKCRDYLARNFNIFMRKSSDNGITWSDTVGIVYSTKDETELTVNKDQSGKISLLYVREDTVKFIDPGYSATPQIYFVSNVYFKESTDFGITWSKEKKLTRYIGDDKFIGTSTNSEKNLITYSSQKATNDYQIYYGIIDEAVEMYHPPKLFLAYSKKIDGELERFLIRAHVKDDEELPKVKVSLNYTNVTENLYDDGNHDDGLANDGIFANSIDIPQGILQSDFMLDVNKIKMPFSNDGKIADNNQVYQFQANLGLSDGYDNRALFSKNFSVGSYGYHKGGKFDDEIFLFAGGFQMSGYANNHLWVNGVAPATLVQDYLPGIFGSAYLGYQSGFYVVKKDDKPFGTSWHQWKDAVNLGAEFYDGDADGVYIPKDKNYNGIWDRNEDMPALLGDLTAWCVYNDGVQPSQRRWQSDIMGIEVRQTIFASSNPDLQNAFFIKYNLLNTGLKADKLDSVYFGVWEDADIGEAWNDFVGCDLQLKSGFAFSNPETDTIYNYGLNPPAFFTTLLQGPVIITNNPDDTAKLSYGELSGKRTISGAKNLDVKTFIMYKGGDPLVNDPSYPNDVRNLMLGKTRFGDDINPCNFAFSDILGGVDCYQLNSKLWFSGDPVTQIGWLLKYPGDVRSLLSTGSFVLEKNKPIEIIAAYVVGRGNDHLNSITVARENVKRTMIEYDSNFSSMTYQPGIPLHPVIEYKLYQNYPNPFNPTTIIRFEIPRDGIVTLKVFNILGEEVATLLNEFRKADRYEVLFDAAKLASGVYIYQFASGEFIASRKLMVVK